MSKPIKSESDGRAECSPWLTDYIREVIHIKRMAIHALDEMDRINAECLSSDALTVASESETINRKIVATCDAFLESGDFSPSALYECFKASKQMAQQAAGVSPLSAERIGHHDSRPDGKT